MKRCPDCSYPNPDHLAACFKCGTALDAHGSQAVAPNPVSGPADQQPTFGTCPQCGSPPEPGGYPMPLCSRCRDTLSSRPLPAWTIVSALLVGVILVFAFARFPAAVRAGVAFERGQRAEEQINYDAAEEEYRKVVAQYPDSTEPLARLAICQCKTLNVMEIGGTLKRLEGREMSKELYDEVDAAVKGAETELDRRGLLKQQ